MMEVNLEGYVYGGCSDEEREAVRNYIKGDFYNAFDVIEMMRDRAYEELSPSSQVRSAVEYSEEDDFATADLHMKFEMSMPSVCGGMAPDIPEPRPHSLLDMLNNYLAKD